MKKHGKITIVVPQTKWYETKPFVIHRTIRNLKRQISCNLKQKDVKLISETFATECQTCGSLTVTIHWTLSEGKASNKSHYNNTYDCNYCWTCR